MAFTSSATNLVPGGSNDTDDVFSVIATPVVSDGLFAIFAAPQKCPAPAIPTVAATIKAIRTHPGQYYVNVHTADYPAGAVRGQLHN